MRRFRQNQSGIVLVGIICIVFIICSSIIGLAGALAVNKVADALTPYLGSDVRALNTVTSARNAYIVAVVLVDVLLLVYWGVSAQRKESQESPSGVYFST
jgi:hypothetical protein